MRLLEILKRADYDHLDVGNVFAGCAGFVLDLVHLPFNKRMAEYRANICEKCELNVEGVCFRDATVGEDYKSFTQEQIRARKHLDRVDDGKATLGCGCLIKCKTFAKGEFCPAQKWLAVSK